jgi:hypothetical protein
MGLSVYPGFIDSLSAAGLQTRTPQQGGGGPGGGGPGGGGPGGGPGGPHTHITLPPGARTDSPGCVDNGFTAEIDVRSKARMRSVKVYVDGLVVKNTARKHFSVWIRGAGLDAGRSTIRVVAVDVNGRRDVDRARFRHCAPAVPTPQFTGRIAAGA